MKTKRQTVVPSPNYNKLDYEETEIKRMSTSKPVIKSGRPPRRSATVKAPTKNKINIKELVASRISVVKNNFSNLSNRLNHPRKNSRKLTKLERETAKKQRNNAILGVGLLLVVVSIAYSTAVIFVGVGSIESKIVLIPQAFFALFTFIKAFSKLYK